MTAEANPQPNAPPSPGGSDAGPWHDGERAIHRRLGLDETIDPIGRRNIRPFMPDQHRLFFAQLPFAFLGALDPGGESLGNGAVRPAGVPRQLRCPIPAHRCLSAGIARGARVALLGIELPTRRRNRMNGVVVDLDISPSRSWWSRALATARNTFSAATTEPLCRRASHWPKPSVRRMSGHAIFCGGLTLPSWPPRPRRAKASPVPGLMSSTAAACQDLFVGRRTARLRSRITVATGISTRSAICSPIRTRGSRCPTSRPAICSRSCSFQS